MKKRMITLAISVIALQGFAITASADGHAHSSVADSVIEKQNATLANNTNGKGYGPQAPRDLDAKAGNNARIFNEAPAYTQMNLCDIHFHENAEHKGGEFTTYAGNGDGNGYNSGFKYNGTLTTAESKPLSAEVCKGKHGGLQVGDTIEIHYVHSTALAKPAPTLGSCLSETDINPQLRVEGQVFVLVNDSKALDFMKLTEIGMKNGYHQALNIPNDMGTPIRYAGSTTGPTYNEKGSLMQVSWSVRPKVAKVNINTVGEWCKSNVFNEDHAHGVRNLVVNPDLLSEMK
ncbi:delta-class carbonic anhydrase [Thiomicrorhabdus aquaedulcis]|uniref:delta-class carbonic anhydrase n=1 Tax=Thiomicrorhabdus aquaedulcis TaxID=2211106 RepID=UPI000FD8C10F|nr:delta-class carbonic anhydrase [Thiomicrorhabdus aquaedulcis]